MTTADELTQGLEQLRDSLTRTARIAPDLARQEIHREGRAYFRGAVVAAVITSLLIGLPLALLANQLAQHANADRVRAAQLQDGAFRRESGSEAQNAQRLARSAYDLGVHANAELTRRGLTPVLIPAPGSAPDSQVLTAAALAQVAANIAGESPAVPTVAQIQAAVALALAKLPRRPWDPPPSSSLRRRRPMSRPTPRSCGEFGGRGEHRDPRRRWVGPSGSPTGRSPPASGSLRSIQLLPATSVRMPHRPAPRPGETLNRFTVAHECSDARRRSRATRWAWWRPLTSGLLTGTARAGLTCAGRICGLPRTRSALPQRLKR